MFMDARNSSGLSREEAAGRLHVGIRTLCNYEHEQTLPPPDVVLIMSDVYNDPSLPARYCSEHCPIGQQYAHSVDNQGSLCQSVLGLLKEYSDVEKIRENLVSIAADGIIDGEEILVFQGIVEELLDLERKIEEIKLHAATMMSIPDMMQKRKRPLCTAAR